MNSHESKIDDEMKWRLFDIFELSYSKRSLEMELSISFRIVTIENSQQYHVKQLFHIKCPIIVFWDIFLTGKEIS